VASCRCWPGERLGAGPSRALDGVLESATGSARLLRREARGGERLEYEEAEGSEARRASEGVNAPVRPAADEDPVVRFGLGEGESLRSEIGDPGGRSSGDDGEGRVAGAATDENEVEPSGERGPCELGARVDAGGPVDRQRGARGCRERDGCIGGSRSDARKLGEGLDGATRGAGADGCGGAAVRWNKEGKARRRRGVLTDRERCPIGEVQTETNLWSMVKPVGTVNMPETVWVSGTAIVMSVPAVVPPAVSETPFFTP
jgi:hypothetical protein